jgi:hypothetical protein
VPTGYHVLLRLTVSVEFALVVSANNPAAMML